MPERPSVVLPHALKLPIFDLLQHRRVILASQSPRRRDVLRKMGLAPEIVPSTFKEDLDKKEFRGRAAEYPVLTAQEKGVEVYERLVKQDDRDPPDLVISADTVVIYPPTSEHTRLAEEQDAPHAAPKGTDSGDLCEILEKPASKEDQIRNLMNMSGKDCEIVTGVAIVYPSIEHPGYKVHQRIYTPGAESVNCDTDHWRAAGGRQWESSQYLNLAARQTLINRHMSCSSLARFFDNSRETIEAYVESGEGLDRAGGFAIQDLGGMLIEGIEGDYDNVVGFPSSLFWRWMGQLAEDGAFDDAWE